MWKAEHLFIVWPQRAHIDHTTHAHLCMCIDSISSRSTMIQKWMQKAICRDTRCFGSNCHSLVGRYMQSTTMGGEAAGYYVHRPYFKCLGLLNTWEMCSSLSKCSPSQVRHAVYMHAHKLTFWREGLWKAEHLFTIWPQRTHIDHSKHSYLYMWIVSIAWRHPLIDNKVVTERTFFL